MGHFNRLFWLATAITLILLSGMPAFADVELYMQPPTLNGAFQASQNDVGGFGNFATIYDNFQIYQTKPYYLTDVEWFGGYWSGPGNVITGWTVTIYADAGMQPGTALWSRYFGINAVGYMESCNLPNGVCAYDEDNIKYGYKLMPFTTYWLSLVPDLKFPPQWGWGTGVLGDNLSYQDFFGNRSQLGVDFAFNVQGVTPEPGTLILLGTGFLALAGTLRRKLF
jgi:hypothetical protein